MKIYILKYLNTSRSNQKAFFLQKLQQFFEMERRFQRQGHFFSDKILKQNLLFFSGNVVKSLSRMEEGPYLNPLTVFLEDFVLRMDYQLRK
jgi:hypothetical protein